MPTGRGPLRIAIEDFIEAFQLGNRVNNWVDSGGNKLAKGSIGQAWSKIMSEIGADSDDTELFSSRSPHAILGLAALLPMLLGAIIGLGFSFISTVIQPLAIRVQYKVARKYPYARISPGQLAQLIRQFPEYEKEWREQMRDLGVDEQTEIGFLRLARNYLTPIDYINAWRRGEISEGQLTSVLKEIQFREDDISTIKAISKIIPSITDLITLQVKEAFNDEASQRFHHDEGDVTQVTEWAAKQGLDTDWVKRYWRAHWQLPSPNQVFEMLQRLRPGTTNNPVTEADVVEYLQIADYSPFWRPRLKEISYLPFTRVDIRRMYKTGVLDEAQVKEAYLDAGYNEKRAQALTEFTVAYEAEEETGVVRQSVIKAYANGMISKAKAQEMLAAGGYDETTIAFYLDSVDFDQQMEVNQVKLSNIRAKFIAGTLDETNVNTEINRLGLPGERVSALLELWTTQRDNQMEVPTLSQMEKFYELEIVTLDDFKRILKTRGFTDENIAWNVKRIDLENGESTKDELAKANNEAVKARSDKKATQYQKDVAEIDLLIAQAKSEIVNITIALHNDVSDVEADAFVKRLDELKLVIAQLHIRKARLKYDYKSKLTEMEL